MMQNIQDAFFVSSTGGVLNYVDEQGEILFDVAIPAGKVAMREYLDLCPLGAVMQPVGVTVVAPRRLGGRVAYGVGATDSGANPDYVPTNATRLELEMRQQIRQAQMLNRSVAARLAALNNIEAMPQAVEGEASLVE